MKDLMQKQETICLVRSIPVRETKRIAYSPENNYTSGSGTIASIIASRSESVDDDNEKDEVTHEYFFGENIRRVINAFKR